MRSFMVHPIRRIPLWLLVCTLALAAALPREAGAQPAPDAAVAPLATARLMRWAELLLAPGDDEHSALGRAHEKYLDGFRSALSADATRLGVELSGQTPADAAFARALDELARLDARVAEADAALFAEAAGAFAEPRRAALALVAAARERQRLTRGVAVDATGPIGNGTAFVDLVDLLSRAAEDAPAEVRGQLAAIAGAESPRLTAEARAFAAAVREGLASWLPALRAFEAPAERLDAVENGRRMAEVVRVATDSGRSLRRILREHHAANRAAIAPLSAAIRERLALRTLGEPIFVALGGERAAEIESLLRRIRGEPALANGIDDAEARWRAARAEVLESFIAAFDAADLASWAASFDTGSAAAEASQQATVRAAESLAAADQALIDALAVALGDRAGAYFAREGGTDVMMEEAGVAPEPGSDDERWVLKPLDASVAAIGETDDEVAPAMRRSFDPGDSSPVTRSEIHLALALTGAEYDRALLDGIYESWRFDPARADGWAARVAPLDAAFAKAAGRAEDIEGETLPPERRDIAAVRALGLQISAGIDAAESDLRASLAGALGVPADHPAWLLAALSTLGRIHACDEIDSTRGDQSVVPDPLRVLAGARVTQDEARVILACDADAWRALAAESRRANDAYVLLVERRLRLEAESAPRVVGSPEMRAARSREITRAHEELVDGVRERVAARFAECAAKVLAEPERRAAITRAVQSESYPAFFSRGESAEEVLDSAAALPGIDDDLRARIEALRAEHLAVFEELGARMIALASTARIDAAPGADSGERDFARKMAEVARIRADRGERTDRALAELRRLLGPERARRVPGLRPGDTSRDGRPMQERSAWDIVSGED